MSHGTGSGQTGANNSLQPTRISAGSSAVADHAFWVRVAELWR